MLIQIDAEGDINKMTARCQLAAARLMMTVPIGDGAQLEKKVDLGIWCWRKTRCELRYPPPEWRYS